jgi:chorismate mutase
MAMTRARDHKAEYLRRRKRGRERGLTASQARGHARAHEVGLKAKPIKSDERLEAALRRLRQTNNQAKAAKEVGVSPERFRRFLREQKLAERKGRIWEINDTRSRLMTTLTTRGSIDLTLPGFATASLVGQHNGAVKSFLDTNDISRLRRFEGLTIQDTSRRTHVLETRPNVIRRLDASGETFEQIYRIVQ